MFHINKDVQLQGSSASRLTLRFYIGWPGPPRSNYTRLQPVGNFLGAWWTQDVSHCVGRKVLAQVMNIHYQDI